MTINEHQLTDIVYESAGKQEITERTIIPTYVPSNNIKAVDVTDLRGDERIKILELLQQYDAYKATFLSSMYNFEDWVEHTTGATVKPKWRTFTVDRILNQK